MRTYAHIWPTLDIQARLRFNEYHLYVLETLYWAGNKIKKHFRGHTQGVIMPFTPHHLPRPSPLAYKGLLYGVITPSYSLLCVSYFIN